MRVLKISDMEHGLIMQALMDDRHRYLLAARKEEAHKEQEFYKNEAARMQHLINLMRSAETV